MDQGHHGGSGASPLVTIVWDDSRQPQPVAPSGDAALNIEGGARDVRQAIDLLATGYGLDPIGMAAGVARYVLRFVDRTPLEDMIEQAQSLLSPDATDAERFAVTTLICVARAEEYAAMMSG